MDKLEIQFDYKSRDFVFRPLQKRFRGTLRMSDVKLRGAGDLALEIPELPGVIIGIEGATGYVRDPLAEDQYAALRAKLREKFHTEPAKREEFAGVDRECWLYWLKRAVDDGRAKLLCGMFPKTIKYRPDPLTLFPRRAKYGAERKDEIFRNDPRTAAAFVTMTPDQRAECEQLVGV